MPYGGKLQGDIELAQLRGGTGAALGLILVQLYDMAMVDLY